MTAKRSNNRIKYALHLADWSFEKGDPSVLHARGAKRLPSDYDPSMEGNLFCPICTTDIRRVPKIGAFTKNERAYFSHLPKYEAVPCIWRTPKPEGRHYHSYEEVQRALEREDLVIVHDFIKEQPEGPDEQVGAYGQTAIEDQSGPEMDLPLGRHTGESVQVPSRIKTVRAITTEFDKKLKKYYVLPGSTQAFRLDSLLHDIRDVTKEDDSPKLYFGIVRTSFVPGRVNDDNLRMTRLHCNPEVHDFTFKAKIRWTRERGLNDESIGRIVIMFGKVTGSGIGLSIERVGWGGFDLLPEKYRSLLGV